ncbi:GNAT family N-acetyltransferase [Poseidonocella sp. HB161398]|uniref:GNAT family N-acetyltransferase n=1 Tax=Poseidonocella sp. HB161398 TaxID=2320855 RepID=UPI00110967A6|nr:GNAT family N-acetyltransferase [Poseidonocella sp. HB161398]
MADKTIHITYEDGETKGRYVARIDGLQGEGELTISKVSDVLIIADHTHVPASMRGQGVAVALADRLVAEARAKGQRIVPLCPFVRSQALRHPDWADVIQK